MLRDLFSLAMQEISDGTLVDYVRGELSHHERRYVDHHLDDVCDETIWTRLLAIIRATRSEEICDQIISRFGRREAPVELMMPFYRALFSRDDGESLWSQCLRSSS